MRRQEGCHKVRYFSPKSLVGLMKDYNTNQCMATKRELTGPLEGEATRRSGDDYLAPKVLRSQQ